MRVTIALLFLINAYLLNAKSLPSTEVVENPCTEENLLRLQFYFPCPNDEMKFIECNPWGMMTVKQCPEGSRWNQWLSSCVIVERVENTPKSDDDEQVPSGPFCTYYGNSTCKNGGFCNQMLTESKCYCQVNFTGDYCERTSIQSTGAFGQLINSTFSLDLYKKQRALVNDQLSINTTFDMSLVKDDLIKQRVQKYLNMYQKDEMRFDVLINYLVQDILSQLYPNAFFLREFNLPSEIQMGYSNAVPNLLQTAKYAYDNYEQFCTILEQVLDNLIDYLPKYMPKIRDEAQNFFEVYDLLFTKFAAVNNITVNDTMAKRNELTRDEMLEEIHQDYNTTLAYAFDLFRLLNVFDDELSVKSENLSSIDIQYAIGNFSVHPEVTRILDETLVKTTEIWDSFSFYAFWYMVSSYVTLPDVDGISKRPYIVDDKNIKPVAGALVGDDDDAVEFVPDDDVLVEKLKIDTTQLPKSGSLVGESTPIPRAGALESESTTTVIPRVGSLVGESTTAIPRVGSLVGESTSIPRTGALQSESTTGMPKVGSLVGESTVIPPRAGALRWEQ